MVETIGRTFMYPLVGQHEPCTRGRKATSSSCTTSWGSPGFTFVQRLAQSS
uniref:Uncharacterized protein n=1 Tax=Aegilops tauschii subsp. strangulata TaxID=200361 RepID=A0A453PFQ8_AEGTS